MKWETNMDDKLKQIINHYGVIPQLKYLQSEVFEFNEAVIRAENKFEPIIDIDHITEEMADVFMYLTDVMLCCRVSAEEFEQAYRAKAEHNLKRDFVNEHKHYLEESK